MLSALTRAHPPMIKKLSLTEVIEAAASLEKPEQAMLIAALAGPSAHQADAPEATLNHDQASDWAALASEGLARAYGDHEPDYSEADLLP